MIDMTNIFRWDNDERFQHYWGVRFQAYKISKVFSDGIHGGREKALEEAVKFRNQIRDTHTPAYSGTAHDRGHYKNTKGIMFKHNKKSGEMRWVAFWDEPRNGKRNQRIKSFNVHKYGSLKARQLATEYRQKMIKELVK